VPNADSATLKAPAVEPDPAPVGPKFASRESLLGAAGRLNEEQHEVEGLGLLLLGEIGADVRAEILTEQQSVALFAEGAAKKLDRKWYEKKILLAGVLDPDSPVGARLPLLKQGDMDTVMRIGGAKIGEVVDAIERLSLMGRHVVSAEGNSNGATNSAGS
jgi:hypothetical protein